MAGSSRAGSAAAPGHDDLAVTVTALARVVARLAVAQSHGRGAASFRQIAVTELEIATDAEAAAIEAWLTSHPGS